MPADEAERTDEQRARWLLAQLLAWHRREDKPDWWTYFHRIGYENDDDFLDDRECIGGLRFVREVGPDKQSMVSEYAFDPQDHKFREGAKPDRSRRRRRARARSCSSTTPTACCT